MKTKLGAALLLLFTFGFLLSAQSFTPDFVLEWNVKYRGEHLNGHYTLDNTYFDIVNGKLTWIGPTGTTLTSPYTFNGGSALTGTTAGPWSFSGSFLSSIGQPAPLVSVSNPGDVTCAGDYCNEAHIRISAGTSTNHREYINFRNPVTNQDDYLMGRNACNAWITYDSAFKQHRLWLESITTPSGLSCTNSGNNYFNAEGTGGVWLNYHATDQTGTGGLRVYSGGQGTGYCVATAANGGGSNAAGTVASVAGVISGNVTITVPGTGYTSAPTSWTLTNGPEGPGAVCSGTMVTTGGTFAGGVVGGTITYSSGGAAPVQTQWFQSDINGTFAYNGDLEAWSAVGGTQYFQANGSGLLYHGPTLSYNSESDTNSSAGNVFLSTCKTLTTCDNLISFANKGTAKFVFGMKGGGSSFRLFDSVQASYVWAYNEANASMGFGRGNTSCAHTLCVQDLLASTGATQLTVGLGAADTATTPTIVNAGVTSQAGALDNVIYSAAGTALPTCSSGTNKYLKLTVSDASSPTYLGTYASGGAVITGVICNGTNWVTY